MLMVVRKVIPLLKSEEKKNMNDPVTDDSNEQRNKKQKIGFVLAFCCLISRWVILAFTTVLHLKVPSRR